MGELSVVEFDMQLEVVNGTNDTCDGDFYNQSYVKTFCTNSTDYSMWKLCDQHVLDDMTFSEQSLRIFSQKMTMIELVGILFGCHWYTEI